MATRAQRGAAIQYEDISPKFEWKEAEAVLLLVYLPGFEKEQQKVTYVHSTRTIRVTGEREIASNKRSRVNQTFPVPQNCDEKRIHAKFLNGILTITMPKATVTQEAAPPKPDPKPTNSQQAPTLTPTPPKPDSSLLGPKEQMGVEKEAAKVATPKATVTQEAAPPKPDPKPDNTQQAPTPPKPDSSLLEPKEQKGVEKEAAKFATPNATVTQEAAPPKPDSKPANTQQASTPTPPKPDSSLLGPKEQKSVEKKAEAAKIATLKETTNENKVETPAPQESLGEPKSQKRHEDQDPLKASSQDEEEEESSSEQEETQTSEEDDGSQGFAGENVQLLMINIGAVVMVAAAAWGAYFYCS